MAHLHITVDDLPRHWVDASGHNTIDIVGLPPGEHKVLIELVNANHKVFPEQSRSQCPALRHTHIEKRAS